MTNQAYAFLSAGIGAGLATIGGGLGIGLGSGPAMEAIGRQPSATNEVRSAMIIAIALVEGVALFAIVACVLLIFATKG